MSKIHSELESLTRFINILINVKIFYYTTLENISFPNEGLNIKTTI